MWIAIAKGTNGPRLAEDKFLAGIELKIADIVYQINAGFPGSVSWNDFEAILIPDSPTQLDHIKN